MEEIQRVEVRVNRWSIALSTLLHGLVCISLFFAPSPIQNFADQESSINVEIVNLPAIDARHKSVAPPSLANALPTPPVPARMPSTTITEQITRPEEKRGLPPTKLSGENTEPKFVNPSQMLSEAVLADTRSSQARQALKQLAPADQIEQLCNLEAMAQVGAWSKELEPDRVVAYAMADPKLSDSDFVAEGAAIHSKRDWYSLQYRCHLTANNQKVVAFEFLIGASIPREVWMDHNLPDEDGASD